MADIDTLIAKLLPVEGGYVNNPADRGGPTNFGITQAVARANGYQGDMRNLPRSTAVAIYKSEYWAKPNFDEVAKLAPALAAEMFDTGVNCGQTVPITFLQRALNVLFGSKLNIDGAMMKGGATLTTLAAYLKDRPRDGAANLLVLVNCFQGERYAELVEKNASQRTFINGWIANRVELDAA